jgi:hypothetical protein
MGVFARRLPDLLGLQTLPDHGRYVTRLRRNMHRLGLGRESKHWKASGVSLRRTTGFVNALKREGPNTAR